MATDAQLTQDPAAAGHAALARADWDAARAHFEAAVAGGESADALEGLGWAGWWTSDAELTFDARERAYRAFREAGDDGAAARVAAWLASDHLEYRGEDSVGRGWLRRAQRLLEDVPEGADHGWVALHEAAFAINLDHEPERAGQLASEASELGRRFRVPDLEAVGLAQEGGTLVVRGQVEEGMQRLEEASAIAASEQLQLPISLGWTLCCMISACDGVGDFGRAAQWCDATRQFSERWGARQLLGLCRSAYARVLATGGDWEGADAELTEAVRDLEASRPAMAGPGLVRLAELRMRQGRAEEARELFERAGPSYGPAQLGLGLLALDNGDAAAAADAAERVLRSLSSASLLDTIPALELLVRARMSMGDLAAAAEASNRLDSAGRELGTPYLIGRALLAVGELAAARGDHDEARRCCEDAVDCFSRGAAPYDAGLARLELGRALAALGRTDAAATEADAAKAIFVKLGAERDAARVDALMTLDAAVAGDGAAAGELSELTPRELDVLRLVAQGLSDAEIAERLVLSPHTVHRHVANVRVKLRLSSRAAAVAYAARSGLL